MSELAGKPPPPPPPSVRLGPWPRSRHRFSRGRRRGDCRVSHCGDAARTRQRRRNHPRGDRRRRSHPALTSRCSSRCPTTHGRPTFTSASITSVGVAAPRGGLLIGAGMGCAGARRERRGGCGSRFVGAAAPSGVELRHEAVTDCVSIPRGQPFVTTAEATSRHKHILGVDLRCSPARVRSSSAYFGKLLSNGQGSFMHVPRQQLLRGLFGRPLRSCS